MSLLDHVLIVEDDEPLQKAVARAFRAAGAQRVNAAGTVREALAALDETPTLVMLDVRLPDGSALDVVDKAHRTLPLPVVVAMSGVASPKEAFELAMAGVRAFLMKPLTMEDLEAAIQSLVDEPPRLSTAAAASVGHTGMGELLQSVRTAMLQQALALSGGNQTGAARLLRISRQAVQQAVLRTSRDKDAS